VLLTTHYMEEAQRLCDRVAILDHGRIIAAGTPRALIASLGAEHVVEFEAAGADVVPLGTLDGVRVAAGDGGTVRLTVTELHRTVPALLAELARQRVELTGLATHHATLEDVFVALTGRHLRDE
jgi:ABC-2 type transport system ATP-binding protein